MVIFMKNDKKELILAAMEQLMSEIPYKDISVEAVAKKAGIGKGSIYYYFESKDDILYEIIERGYRRAIREYFDSIDPSLPALAKIKQLFKSVIKEGFNGNERNLIVTLHLNDDMLLHNKLKCVAVQEISPILTELLVQGIGEGTVETDSPGESSEIIVAVLTFLIDETIFRFDSVSMQKKMKIFANVLETCLKTKRGSFDFLYTLDNE